MNFLSSDGSIKHSQLMIQASCIGSLSLLTVQYIVENHLAKVKILQSVYDLIKSLSHHQVYINCPQWQFVG